MTEYEKQMIGKVDVSGYERWIKYVNSKGEVWAVKPKNYKER